MNSAALSRAVTAYDEARCASHGPFEQPMSDRNRETIAPMILAAVEAYNRAPPDAETVAAALVILARRFNLPPDIQELLVAGNPQMGVPPGALADALSSQSLSLSEEREEIERLREKLCPADDWKDKLDELYSWSGSAFLAGEKVEDEAGHKSRLYGFLCRLIGYLMAGQDAASVLENSKPALADATKESPLSDLSSLRKGAEDGLTALVLVRSIIVEAAMTGFNCHDGDWAERLYVSQGATHEAVKNLRAALVSGSREDGDG